MSSWIPFYHELTQKVLTFENKQTELIATMEKMRTAQLPIMFLEEYLADRSLAQLTEIDPFTFVMNLNITSSENARKMCEWLKKEWKLGAQLPADFVGLPTFMPRAPWFFPAIGDGRGPDDIPNLWQLARDAWGSNDVDANLYRECLKIKGVGPAKLTTGLYWFSPSGFLPINGKTSAFLKARGFVWDEKKLNAGSYEEYKSLISKSHDITFEHPDLVRQSWEWVEGPIINPPSDAPLNTILYGPPGTGKTYNTISRAVEIIDNTELERAEAVLRFEELREQHRIGFVTFHQSYAYEEFIEGLRPDIDEGAQGGARYRVRAGTLKQMALRALGACLEAARPQNPTFEDAWQLLLDKTESDSAYEILGLSANSSYKVTAVTTVGIVGTNTVSDLGNYSCPRRYAESVWNAQDDKDNVNTTRVEEVLEKGTHRNFVAAVVNELFDLAKTLAPLKSQTLDPLVAAQSYLAGSSDYRLKDDLARVPRFVLIMDEINRGNISKILGELITLLEDDKRLGEPNALRVILPYSGETFALPPNLYLIGTMNTADKSLALLDVALRRRFHFEEMAPNFSTEICPDLPPNMRAVLEELNRRLLRVLDREHRLGHAFFIKVRDVEAFNEVFHFKIVPLLQEFFYNDWEGLRAVLGETGAGGIVRELKVIDGVRGRNSYGWWNDLDEATPDFLAVLLANYKIKDPNAVVAPSVLSTDATTEDATSEGA